MQIRLPQVFIEDITISVIEQNQDCDCRNLNATTITSLQVTRKGTRIDLCVETSGTIIVL